MKMKWKLGGLLTVLAALGGCSALEKRCPQGSEPYDSQSCSFGRRDNFDVLSAAQYCERAVENIKKYETTYVYYNHATSRFYVDRCISALRNLDLEWDDVGCTNEYSSNCKIPLEEVEKTCEFGEAFGSDQCLLVSSGLFNSSGGEAFCVSRGMKGASVHSQQENDRIKVKLEAMSWLGLVDTHGLDHFDWTDGTSFDFQNWAQRGPTAAHPRQRCVAVTPAGLWTSASCTEQKPVVCLGPMKETIVPRY